MTQIIRNVSDTAFMVAGFRALETEFLRDRGDPISADWGRNPGEGVIDMPPGRLDEEDV